jgi:hypothetical protein
MEINLINKTTRSEGKSHLEDLSGHLGPRSSGPLDRIVQSERKYMLRYLQVALALTLTAPLISFAVDREELVQQFLQQAADALTANYLDARSGKDLTHEEKKMVNFYRRNLEKYISQLNQPFSTFTELQSLVGQPESFTLPGSRGPIQAGDPCFITKGDSNGLTVQEGEYLPTMANHMVCVKK